MTVKAIIFDLGKVLVDFEWKRAAEKLREQSSYTDDRIVHLCSQLPINRIYEQGLITSDQYFRTLSQELGIEDSSGLREIWCDIFSQIKENIRLPGLLKNSYHVGLLSNTSEAHHQWIEARFPFMADFHRKTVSYKTGALKPAEAIYLAAVDGLEYRPNEILFIDDLEANIAGALELGWNVVHLKPATSLDNQLRGFGIDI